MRNTSMLERVEPDTCGKTATFVRSRRRTRGYGNSIRRVEPIASRPCHRAGSLPVVKCGGSPGGSRGRGNPFTRLDPPPPSSRRRNSLAIVQSRATVPGETPSASAVSSTLKPPKKRSSTTCALRGSTAASACRASSIGTKSESDRGSRTAASCNSTFCAAPPRPASRNPEHVPNPPESVASDARRHQGSIAGPGNRPVCLKRAADRLR